MNDIHETQVQQASFTPGPWSCSEVHYSTHGKALRQFIGIGTGAEHIGYVSVTGCIPEPQAMANARLIVAAPDLLAALRHARTAMNSWQKEREIQKAFSDTCNTCSFSCALETVEAALEKAEGNEIV